MPWQRATLRAMEICFACVRVETAAPLIATWATLDDRVHVARRSTASAQVALAARAAVRALLARETVHATWTIRTTPSGKPYAWAPGMQVGPAITLSHSRHMVAVAIGPTETPLGIDIEAHKCRAYDDIAAFTFGPDERAAVEAGGADVFYRIWTAREARAKATGHGLAEVLVHADLTGASVDLGCWQHDGFFFRHLRPFSCYSLTIAAVAPLASARQVNLK